MSKGISIHVGIDKLDGSWYPGFKPLKAAYKDASAMQELAYSMGFSACLMPKNIQKESLVQFISDVLKILEDGDFLLFTFAGHGAQIPKDDPIHETLCFYYMQMLDSEVYSLFDTLEKDIRILLIFDSCHSGDAGMLFESPVEDGVRSRDLAFETMVENVKKNAENYLMRIERFKEFENENIRVPVYLMAACRKEEVAKEDDDYGFYTRHFLKAWEMRNATDTIPDLHDAIKKSMLDEGITQIPQLKRYGGIHPRLENEPILKI